jgi:hypothetical protein
MVMLNKAYVMAVMLLLAFSASVFAETSGESASGPLPNAVPAGSYTQINGDLQIAGTGALFFPDGSVQRSAAVNGCPNDLPNITNLLFSFVTNQSGFDTGISISNTASDPFGTVGVSGACRFYYYGAGAPPSFLTGSIAPGATYVNQLSTLAPGFQGYAIVRCFFPYAHGFAFLSDVGARNLAMGYLPLVVCTTRNIKPEGLAP